MAVKQTAKRLIEPKPQPKKSAAGTTSKKSTKKNSKKLSPKEINALILENQEDAEKMAWKLLGSLRVQLTKDDVVSVVGIALCEAASRFDPSFNTSFKTFLYYHLRGILLKEVSEPILSLLLGYR